MLNARGKEEMGRLGVTCIRKSTHCTLHMVCTAPVHDVLFAMAVTELALLTQRAALPLLSCRLPALVLI